MTSIVWPMREDEYLCEQKVRADGEKLPTNDEAFHVLRTCDELMQMVRSGVDVTEGLRVPVLRACKRDHEAFEKEECDEHHRCYDGGRDGGNRKHVGLDGYAVDNDGQGAGGRCGRPGVLHEVKPVRRLLAVDT